MRVIKKPPFFGDNKPIFEFARRKNGTTVFAGGGLNFSLMFFTHHTVIRSNLARGPQKI